MLQFTTDAAGFLRQLQSDRESAEELLRVAPRVPGDRTTIQLTFVAAPQDTDQLGESEGLPYCVAEDVADQLDQTTMDLTETDAGRALVLRRS